MAEDGIIDLPLFEHRVGLIRAGLPVDVEGVLIVRGLHDEDTMPEYLTTYSMQVFLTRTELANTIILVLRDEVFIASGKKKSLANLQNQKGITMLMCNAKQDVNSEPFHSMLNKVKSGKVGVIENDLKHMKGPNFAEKFMTMLKDVDTQDLQKDMQKVLRVKDPKELAMHKKAGAFCKTLFQKGFVKELQKTFEMDKKTTHEKFSQKLDSWIDDSGTIKGMETIEEISPAFPASVLSGDFPVAFPGKPDSTQLSMTNVSAIVGVRWRQYSTLVGRTYLINPTDEQKAAYDAALNVRAELIKGLKPGAKLADVWKGGYEAAKEDLRGNLLVDMGFGTGVEWKDEGLVLTKDSEGVAEEGNVVVVRVRLDGLKGAEGAKYVIELVDTVVVTKEVENDSNVLTAGCRFAADATHLIDDDAEEDEEEEDDAAAPKQRKTTENYALSRGGKWNTCQSEILAANKKAYAGITKEQHKAKQSKDYTTAGKLAKGELSNLIDSSKMKPTTDLQVDLNKEVLYMPIGGNPAPFHISTIMSTKQETHGDSYIMRLTFKVGQAGAGFTPFNSFPKSTFVKELAYKCDISRKAEMEKLRAHIRTIVANTKKRDAAKTDGGETVADCSGLRKKTGGGARLLSVFPRPAIGKGKGMTKPLGDFEAHENGFRFTTKVSPKPVDILYSNVKHIIAAPNTPKHERFAAVHLRLHQPIELATGAKTKDFHVYTEVRDEGENLTGGKTDREDELEEEQEQRIIDKINREFVGFVNAMKGKLPNGTIEIAEPSGYFEGVTGSPPTLGYISTTLNTMNSVLDSRDFFILTMDLVEVVVFERVVQGQQNFDAIFVLKDYTKPVQQVTNIPVHHMAQLKDMLCFKWKVKFYESEKTNLWTNVMKEIKKQDAAGDWEPWGSNGWEGIFNLDAGESGSDTSDTEGSEDSDDDIYSQDSDDSDSDSSDEWSGEDESFDSGSESESESDESSRPKRKRAASDEGGSKKRKK